MKNTKLLLSTGIVLAIALFASVQMSAMQKKRSNTEYLEARLDALEEALIDVDMGNILIKNLRTKIDKDQRIQSTVDELQSINNLHINKMKTLK